ncbi:hypothetical protein ALC56_03220 [Trachymyrmex septentrionalis]|uniref:Uncharacterized protein n=1 Tax=Trachymyrmex septentrionalis TaxID=34720 RepID=A0A195FP41_9HYME|nr:hypothetical protein ALC56_03220 [Trachymyrmex septentrionalis]
MSATSQTTQHAAINGFFESPPRDKVRPADATRAIKIKVRKSRENLSVKVYYYSVFSDRHGHRVDWGVGQSTVAMIAAQKEFSVFELKVGHSVPVEKRQNQL